MKHARSKQRLFPVVVLLLLAAMITGMTACNDQTNETAAPADTYLTDAVTEIGEGQNSFLFEVAFPDGTTAAYTVRTDAATVGEALTALSLIEGEQGIYGLYVKVVCGVPLDYNTHGKYWAFYEDGAYAMAGVDTTPVREGAVYAFRAE